MVPVLACLSWIHILQYIFSLHLPFLCCIILAVHSFRDWLSHPIPTKHFQLISLQHSGELFIISSTCMTLHFNLVLFLLIQIFWYSVLISVLPSTFMASANFIITDLKLCQNENKKIDEFQDHVLRNLTRNHLDTVWNICVLLSLKIHLCQFYNLSINSNLFSRFTNSIPSAAIPNIPIRWLDRKMHCVVSENSRSVKEI